jgi:predicted DNA-binding transcriptional regulator
MDEDKEKALQTTGRLLRSLVRASWIGLPYRATQPDA